MIYYFECEPGGRGKTYAENDRDVIQQLKTTKKDRLLVVYKESDTEDGTPFITLFKKGEMGNGAMAI